jgi:hypothetical protein
MNEHDLQEENMRRLIKAGFSSQPNPAQEKMLYRKLLKNLEASREAVEFPWQAAVILSTLLLVLAGWILYQGLESSGAAFEPGLLIAGALVLLNLVVLPFASLSIVIRRRHA